MKYAIILILSIFLISCGTSKTYTEQDHKDFQDLQAMVTARNFEIKSNFAKPSATVSFSKVANSNILGPGNNASSIDITGSSNNLIVKGDSIKGYFPYFGELQFGGGYPGTNHQGIEFNTIPDDYKVDVLEDKHKVTISFRINDAYRKNENYNVYITLFPNNRSSIQINSTSRSSIEYTGTVSRLKEDKIE